jgi:hypothetical protein
LSPAGRWHHPAAFSILAGKLGPDERLVALDLRLRLDARGLGDNQNANYGDRGDSAAVVLSVLSTRVAREGRSMGFLDIYPQEQERAAKFQPYEGTRLPDYYDPHQQEILIGGTIIMVAVALLIAAFRYRIYLRSLLTTILGRLLARARMACSKVRLFWIEVEDKANKRL